VSLAAEEIAKRLLCSPFSRMTPAAYPIYKIAAGANLAWPERPLDSIDRFVCIPT
jgi:hypothetical protein